MQGTDTIEETSFCWDLLLDGPGGGVTWIRAGALSVGHLCALKARVALALGLGAGLDRDGLIRLLADPPG